VFLPPYEYDAVYISDQLVTGADEWAKVFDLDEGDRTQFIASLNFPC
jgi:hypothetical protein